MSVINTITQFSHAWNNEWPFRKNDSAVQRSSSIYDEGTRSPKTQAESNLGSGSPSPLLPRRNLDPVVLLVLDGGDAVDGWLPAELQTLAGHGGAGGSTFFEDALGRAGVGIGVGWLLDGGVTTLVHAGVDGGRAEGGGRDGRPWHGGG